MQGGGDVTRLLQLVRDGSEESAGELFGLLYGEMRAMASGMFRSQKASHTLQPTALVHEAYLKMIRPGSDPGRWQDRTHFCRVAAKAMRQILVNHARDKAALKRGGGQAAQRLTIIDGLVPEFGNELEVLAVHEALEELAKLDERQSRIAELRFFAGLTTAEAAEALGVSPRTVELDWTMAKQFLADRLG
jgi:RNA polymerase sigma factor (TIGR02999 family)